MIERIEIIISRDQVLESGKTGELICITAYDEDDDAIQTLDRLSHKQAGAIVKILMAALHKGN